MKKLKQKTGETLTETLVALVIMALALIMLPGAVVAAARVNATMEKQVIFMEKTLEAEKGVKAGSCDITFSMDSISSTVSAVEVTRFGSEETGLYEIGLHTDGE